MLELDPEVEYRRLSSELALETDHTSYAHVAAALDVADRRYFEASRLARAAKLEEHRVDYEVELKLEIMRTSARSAVELEKRAAAQQTGSKAVGRATIEEVHDRMRSTWSDEVRALERRREEYHAARAVTEELSSAWRSRAASLRELVAGLRGRI